MPVKSVAFTKIMVRDLAAQERFYCGVLGFTPGHRLADGEGADAFSELVIALGASQIVLMQYLHKPAPVPGEAILGLMVDDVDETLAAIVAGGGAVAVPAVAIPAFKLRIAYAADPEGHMLELMQVMAG